MEYFTTHYQARIVVVRYRDDPNTQYTFNEQEKVKLVFKDEVDVQGYTDKLNPDVIILSNWRDKHYSAVCRSFLAKIPVVLALDNPYTGDAKQKILTILSALTIRKVCNRVWVAGPAQYEYAKRLGYNTSDIYFDLYSANDTILKRVAQSRTAAFAKRILFVGRLVAYKQPDVLADVFDELSKDNEGWTLTLAGEGPLKEKIKEKHYKKVQVIDFISPSDLPDFYSTGGIFCLPSKGEHWGVAVHEAALAGLPLLLSDSVQSAAIFLKHGYNGYVTKTGNRNSLRFYLKELMNKNDESLKSMAFNSSLLGSRITKATWAASLNSMIIS